LKTLPAIGFGCSPWRGERRVDLEPTVRAALAAGYRLFDLAELYGNERALGRAFTAPEAPPRRELFLVGKVWRTNFAPEKLRSACEGSLTRLGVDAFDLYLLHAPEPWPHLAPLDDPDELGWDEFRRRAAPTPADAEPPNDFTRAETWEAMRDLERRGLVGAIGVSNFAPTDSEELAPPPWANQIHISPRHPRASAVEWFRARGIRLLAHSPLSGAAFAEEPVVQEIARRHGRSPAQIVLRWNVECGFVPLPSSTDPRHLAENLRILDFALDGSDLAGLATLAESA
jgi:alcohol dehydrogenase (NADP+)